MKPGWIVAIVLLSWSGVAAADKRKAMDLFVRGEKAYNLGRFAEAITLFEEAYREESAAAFLLNIAQAYRQLDDCDKAVFFYKRFLSNDPKTRFRAEIEGRIVELEARCAERKKIKERPPEGIQAPAKIAVETSTRAVVAVAKPAPPPPKREEPPPVPALALVAELGVAFHGLGALEVPAQVSVRVAAGHPIAVGGRLIFEPGISASFATLPYGDATAMFSAIAANAVVRYELAPRWWVRAEAGGGALVISGLGRGNPLTIDGVRASGPLSTALGRGGVGFDYRISEAVAVVATPFVISVSPPKRGLREEIGLISRVEIAGGFSIRW